MALLAAPADGALQWKSVRTDARLLADGSVEVTEHRHLLVSGDTYVAQRHPQLWLPGWWEFVDLASVGTDGEERNLERGSYGEAGRFVLEGSRLIWTLRPEVEGHWEEPTELRFVARWKVREALQAVRAPRPPVPPGTGSTFSRRLAERWRETAEAFRRAGPNPSRRYVLDLDLAEAGREGAIDVLEFRLTADPSWRLVGPLGTAAPSGPLPAEQGADVSFLVDRVAPGRPAWDRFHPALLAGLAALPLLVAVFHVARTVLRRRRRLREAQEGPCPERPEQLSPELFQSLLTEGPARVPLAADVWARLRNGGAVVVDRQEPPNLVLRADIADLRRPEAALAGSLFVERASLPVAAAREAAAKAASSLDELVESAFAEEKAQWIGAGARSPERVPETGLLDVGIRLRAVLIGACLFAMLVDEPPEVVGTIVAVVLALAVALFLLARKARRGGVALDGVLVPAVASFLLAPSVLALVYLFSSGPKPFGDLPSALVAWLVLGIGFQGAAGAARPAASGIHAWALAAREALREQLVRSGGEVEPGEAPWFRAAGLEVSLSEPEVSPNELTDLLGVPSRQRS